MLKKQLLLMLLMAFFAPVAMNGQTHNQRLNENFDGNGFQIHLKEYAADGWYAYNAGNGSNCELFEGGTTYAHSGNNCLMYYAYHSGYAANYYLVSEPFYVGQPKAMSQKPSVIKNQRYAHVSLVFYYLCPKIETL